MQIVLALVEVFTVWMQRNVCERALERKRADAMPQIITWSVFYVISNVFTYFLNLPFWMNMIVFSLLFFGVLSWLYKGTIPVKLILVLFLCLIGVLSELIVYFIGIMFGIDLLHTVESTQTILMYIILSKLVWFVEIKIALLFLKKHKNIIIRKIDWIEVFIIPISSIFIVLAMFVPLVDQHIWVRLIAAVMVLVINLFAFYNYNELQEKALYQAEKQFLTQQVESYAEKLREMSKVWQQTREYRHDMKQKSLLLESYLSRKQYDKIRELYQQGIENQLEDENISSTGNVSFDTIVNYKAAVAKKNGIRVKLQTMIPYDIKLDDVALYSLVGNLFDNAIEATQKVEEDEREIQLVAKMSGNNLYLEFKNPYKGELRRKEDSYLTTKENRNEHGMGLRIVENIVERYHGQIVFEDSDHYFRAKVLIYNMGE